MQFLLNFNCNQYNESEVVLVPVFIVPSKKAKEEPRIVISHWPVSYRETFLKIDAAKHFKAKKGETFQFSLSDGRTVLALGLGEKRKLGTEDLRKEMAKVFKSIKEKYEEMAIDLDGLAIKKDIFQSIYILVESILMADYSYSKHKSKETEKKLKKVILYSKEKKSKLPKAQKSLEQGKIVSESVNLGRDLVNGPPNTLNSETLAKTIEQDAKKLKRVKIKVLGKPEIKKEKMRLFLSVNAGSQYGPRLVELSYLPKKVTSKTKHLILVGKGLTFDSGGYSLKPSASMMDMKVDMAGAATMYSAFRATALLNSNMKITCLLGLTDNAISRSATMPGSIVEGRSGKTVEILNTDAEGRLVLADLLDYACDKKADFIIDSATLTGAVLVALGHEICGET